MSARDELLGRVRAALRDAPAPPEVERSYRRTGPAGEEAVRLFCERVADYEATVERLPLADLAAALAERCEDRRMAVPPDLPAGWRPSGAVEDSPPLPPQELDRLDGVISGCALAIAETGTIVLDAGASQGRRVLTLVPDWHLCVVEEGQIVGGVPEAVAALGPAVREGRPLTFISGPSATSDIELSRVGGVHGPRTLDVLVVR
ncbi:MAG: LutC/YkgG family protein [Thermoleophilaceae bacterium]